MYKEVITIRKMYDICSSKACPIFRINGHEFDVLQIQISVGFMLKKRRQYSFFVEKFGKKPKPFQSVAVTSLLGKGEQEETQIFHRNYLPQSLLPEKEFFLFTTKHFRYKSTLEIFISENFNIQAVLNMVGDAKNFIRCAAWEHLSTLFECYSSKRAIVTPRVCRPFFPTSRALIIMRNTQ
ncbi:hypothetical protein LOAG_02602 [Loa loa]|uniref:Uncharacterized protein n=1 Tax=Loa loa TaxID=7209 RepID=A0A1S0U658_LOALO|nr:hypothetical protein LOAG_02602 [Loa loa]EFO25886.1 hypothetical protein LOAG_02602 [Loa loa]